MHFNSSLFYYFFLLLLDHFSAGNMLHLIIEACISRKLIDTSAYLWPGYVVPSGTLKDTALPQESPWLNFMKGSRLSGPLIDALVASPASRCVNWLQLLLCPKV
jgi:hypothetical protein